MTRTAADADFFGHPLGEWAAIDGVPAEIALAFDLGNSKDERTFPPHRPSDGRELLASPADLEGWLGSRGFDVGSVTDEDLALARRVREVVRSIARANVDPAARGEAKSGLDDLADRLPLRLRMDDAGDLRVAGAVGGVRGALATVFASAFDPSGREAWSRLKMCAAPDCRWVFFDHSKPRTGRWCRMPVCGNRMKTRTYRRRRTS